VNAGFAGPIYCTAATADVTRVILNDAAKIQEEDAEYLNPPRSRPDEPPVLPLYRVADVAPVLRLFKPVETNKPIDLGRGVVVHVFRRGAHPGLLLRLGGMDRAKRAR
jgi:metallo-beta-lactamase family protein